MSKDWFEKIKPVVIENNTFQIFRVEQSGGKLSFEFLWGKVDFKYEAEIQGDLLKRSRLAIKRQEEWYEFVKTSGHGIFFEETYWKSADGKEVYIDTPAKFSKLSDQLAQKIHEGGLSSVA